MKERDTLRFEENAPYFFQFCHLVLEFGTEILRLLEYLKINKTSENGCINVNITL